MAAAERLNDSLLSEESLDDVCSMGTSLLLRRNEGGEQSREREENMGSMRSGGKH